MRCGFEVMDGVTRTAGIRVRLMPAVDRPLELTPTKDTRRRHPRLILSFRAPVHFRVNGQLPVHVMEVTWAKQTE